jgi:hypothetical protein
VTRTEIYVKNVACLATLVALCWSFGSASAAERNLVRGRSYEYWPLPAYQLCKDEGDKTQLTDGYTAYTVGRIWPLKSTVGWVAGVRVPVVIWFDLGAPSTLVEVRFNTTGGGGAGVVDVGLQIYASLDDKSYVLAGERPAPPLPAPGKESTRGIQMRVPLNNVKARFLAVVAMPPAPHYFVMVDEIEVRGHAPADSSSVLPALPPLAASGAKGLQELFAASERAAEETRNLCAPVAAQLPFYPGPEADSQRRELATFASQVLREPGKYEEFRRKFTSQHRRRAREVYGTDSLVWEVPPDEPFGMLSLPDTRTPSAAATIDMAINALEASGLGAANLTDQPAALEVNVAGAGVGAPKVTPRIARFFLTTNARYVPDALLVPDSPPIIPAGEARLIWLEAESTAAKPGAYAYKVTVRIGEREHAISLGLRVHDVTLSNETPLATGNWAYLDRGAGPLNLALRDSMLRHRITVGAASSAFFPFPKKDRAGKVLRPIELDFTGVDETLTFYRDFRQVSWFFPFNYASRSPTGDLFGPAQWMSDEFQDIFREWLRQCVQHIRARGRDYDQFYFQMFDETLDPKVAEICRLVRSVDPQVRLMLSIPDASAKATRELVDAGMRIYMYHAPRLSYDNAPDGFPILSSGGRQLWLYGAADSAAGDGKERDPLVFYRLMHWLAFRHGAVGVHFWNMVNNATSGWIDEAVGQVYWPQVYTISARFPAPADVKTQERVIPSRRWEYERMGIEDYMLLSMARDRISKVGADAPRYRRKLEVLVREVLTGAARDRRLFRKKHAELLELVEQLPAPTK